MDNASIHKTQEVKSMLHTLKLKVFLLPTYSPEINQIEHLFSWVKRKLSKSDLDQEAIDESAAHLLSQLGGGGQ
jgi:transposase